MEQEKDSGAVSAIAGRIRPVNLWEAGEGEGGGSGDVLIRSRPGANNDFGAGTPGRDTGVRPEQAEGAAALEAPGTDAISQSMGTTEGSGSLAVRVRGSRRRPRGRAEERPAYRQWH